MKLITDGLIIGEQSVGEKDRLVTVLTRKSGVIRAFVKNCKSLKSAKGAATRLLCYSRLSIYCGRDTYIIDDAVCEEMFINLRNDIEDMSLSQYFCELSEHFAPKETDAEDFLRLILNALYLLNKKKRPAKLIKAVVELRMMCISGYMPDLVCCSFCKCYESEEMYFLPYSGKLVCFGCISKSNEHSIKIPRSVVTAMRHCVYSEFNKLFSFKLSTNGTELLERCSEEYILYTSEHNFKTLAFYKNIK